MNALSIASIASLAIISVFGVVTDFPTADEYMQLKLLNDLRAAGHTCPNGEEFPPNDIPLKWDCRLWRASRGHSVDMADNDVWGHTGSNGSSPGDRARAQGINWSGENIAAGNPDPVESFEQWVESWAGHCNSMMNPSARTMGAGYGFNPLAQYWSYWTQMTSWEEPDTPEAVNCLNDDGSLPEPLFTPNPTPFPTLEGDAVDNHDYMNFEMTSWELELLELINQARKEGNKEECYGHFYKDLEPLEWNCGLFKAAREHLQDKWDHKETESWGRDGTNGETFEDRSEKYGVPHSCSGWVLKGSDGDDSTTTPAAIVERMIDMACWAVFSTSRGIEPRSFGAAFARYDEAGPQDKFPYRAWVILFNNHKPPEHIQTCGGGGDAPTAPLPTPAPVETTPAPTDEPTLAPTDAPSLAPVEPSEPPTDPPSDVTMTCADYPDKKSCRKTDINCCWKGSECRDKIDICPKQKTSDKCDKFGCIWDGDLETCHWVVTSE